MRTGDLPVAVAAWHAANIAREKLVALGYASQLLRASGDPDAS